MTPNSADSSARVFSPESAVIATRALNSALCCFLFMPTSHAPLDRLAFSLSRCPKNRSRRSLPTTVGALVGEGFGLQQPSPPPATTRTDEPLWPTPLAKVLRTCAFRRKAPLEFDQRPRKPSLRSIHDTHPCSSDTMSSLPLCSCFVH